MCEKDIRNLLDFEVQRGNIRELSNAEIKKFVKEFNDTLNMKHSMLNSNYSFVCLDTLFTQMIQKYKKVCSL